MDLLRFEESIDALKREMDETRKRFFQENVRNLKEDFLGYVKTYLQVMKSECIDDDYYMNYEEKYSELLKEYVRDKDASVILHLLDLLEDEEWYYDSVMDFVCRLVKNTNDETSIMILNRYVQDDDFQVELEDGIFDIDIQNLRPTYVGIKKFLMTQQDVNTRPASYFKELKLSDLDGYDISSLHERGIRLE